MEEGIVLFRCFLVVHLSYESITLDNLASRCKVTLYHLANTTPHQLCSAAICTASLAQLALIKHSTLDSVSTIPNLTKSDLIVMFRH
jgi:hypothetical protein